VQRDAVPPQRTACRQQARAERPAELVERSPARIGDLLWVVRGELYIVGSREEDVRLPRQLGLPVAEESRSDDEVAHEPHAQPGLLERLANGARLEVLAWLDPAARRAPDVLREVRLADQGDPIGRVQHEERDVVRAQRVVRRERELGGRDLAFPFQQCGVAVPAAQRFEDGFRDVHDAIVPRVRRVRRRAPVLELLAATLPELRRGLGETAARTVAYELFEKLGYGAVAVTDRRRVLAFVGAGADHHHAGDSVIRPVYEALAQDRPLLAPLALRVECRHPACPLGAAAVVPLRLSDGPAGAVVAYATDGSPLDEPAVDVLEQIGDQLSAQLQLSELATATSTALQAQMEPHFVFNALNTIASLIRTDPDRARDLVRAFADYTRWKLSRPGELVTLEEELHHVQSYLDLEQARFGSQLQVHVDASPAAREVRLPPLLIQPLVENAIKHGKTDRPLHLLVRARVRRGRLRVTVRDDGRGIAREALERVLEPGVTGDESEGTGLGLANVHRRLTAFYGEGVKLRSFPFGTVVRLEVPAA
jgi:signal transduction histidine kinase